MYFNSHFNYNSRKYRKILRMIAAGTIVCALLFVLLSFPAFADEPDQNSDSVVSETEELQDEDSDVPETEELQDEDSDVPEIKELQDGIFYYETGSDGSAAFLVINANQSVLALLGTEFTELSSFLESNEVVDLDALILASGDEQLDELKELCDGRTIGHVYSPDSGSEVRSYANSQNINTDYQEYISVGSENIILYPDGYGHFGIFLFDLENTVFLANGFSDMSVLDGHQEVAMIDLLVINGSTGTDASVIALMDPELCLIAGDMPSDKTLSAFYEQEIAETGAFYVLGPDNVIRIDSTQILEEPARLAAVEIYDPADFVEVTDPAEQAAEEKLVDAALRAARGELGSGTTRTDNLRNEGFSEEERNEIQKIVDSIYNNNMGNCIGVYFDTEGYAKNPEYQIVSLNKTATEPEPPTCEGREFSGWYLDEACTEKFDFSEPLTSSKHLYAGWDIPGEEDEASGENAGSVEDGIPAEDAVPAEISLSATELESELLAEEPVVEPEPQIEEEPAMEPEPQTEEEPVVEPEPQTEEEPAMELEPQTEEVPAAEPELQIAEPAAAPDEPAKEKPEQITMKDRELFYLYTFLAQEGIMDEARIYIEEHMDIPTPFED